MTVFARYLSGQFLARCLGILAGVAIMALAFDLMDAGKDIVRDAASPWLAIMTYGILRLPSLVSTLLPAAALLAGLITMGHLHRHLELVVIQGCGVSSLTLVRLLLPVGLLLTALQFAVDDFAAPRATERLYAWGVGEYEARFWRPRTKRGLWLYSGDDIVRLTFKERESQEIAGANIFHRDAEGLLLERIDAARAQVIEEGLLLQDAVRYDAAMGTTTAIAEMTWRGRIDLGAVDVLARQPSDLSLAQLAGVIANQGYGQRPTDIYRTWLHARIAGALQPALLLLLSLSIMPPPGRTGGRVRVLLSGISVGFAAFVFSGVSVAMGEAGLLPPWLAAWGPVLALASFIGWLLVRQARLAAARSAPAAAA
jgi:lipopolysaccharide export system permease protein